MSNKEFEFKVGDIVGHVLWDGEFELGEAENGYSKAGYSLFLKLEDGDGLTFSANGKEVTSHDKPSIYLIRRPKKMVEKQIDLFANVYKDGICEHNSEKICKGSVSSLRKCLNPDNKKVIITYFVEENNG